MSVTLIFNSKYEDIYIQNQYLEPVISLLPLGVTSLFRMSVTLIIISSISEIFVFIFRLVVVLAAKIYY